MNIRSLRVIHFINHFIELHENESEASENISFTKKVLIQEICDCCYGNLFSQFRYLYKYAFVIWQRVIKTLYIFIMFYVLLFLAFIG